MSDYNNPSAQSERITAIADYFQPKKPAWNLPKIPIGNAQLAGPQKQNLSRSYQEANDFITVLRNEGPQAAYAKYGAGQINELFDAAAGYGLVDPGERESIWAAFNAPAQTGTGTASNTTSILPMSPRAAAPASATGEITEEMAMRSGGWINALENQWAAGNRIEPKPSYFKTNAQYREYYQKWRDLH